MKAQKFFIGSSEINKIQFSEIESYLEDKGLDVNECFNLLADEHEYVYVSNGFVTGLKRCENDEGEWHHFFKKDEDGTFTAGKMMFN